MLQRYFICNIAITHGVPQGSILGPLLFILYINNLAGVSEKLFTILFADDTTILIEGTQVNSMITSLNSELAKLTDWLKANTLSINCVQDALYGIPSLKTKTRQRRHSFRKYYYKASSFTKFSRNI